MPPSHRETISAVIITKNEEGKIVRCLESVKWVDEIVIVDDESCDDTIKICKRYTDKTIVHKLDGDFVRQRNIGIEQARGDWILQMDADEIVSKELRQEIEKLLESNSDFAGIKFKRKNYFLDKALLHGGWHHDFLRLFRRNAGRYLDAGVHELIDVNGKIGKINADMEHYTCQDISQFTKRHNYYTSLEAERLLRERGLVSEKEIRYHMSVKPLKVFWKTYIKKHGFRDGIPGLIYCIFNAYIHAIKWAKYWELIKKE